MSLQLILGNSGSGKSNYIYNHVIKASLAQPQGSFLVIVPEQFTMQTQRELVRLHPDGGIMNIDILSFPRLAHRVFEETGMDRRAILTETGKSLMIRRLAMRMRGDLPVLGSRLNLPGYVAEMKSVLSELMQYEVTDGELERLTSATGDHVLLQAKLREIRKLYAAFLEEQKETYFKPEELLHQLCLVADRSELLKRSTIVFDCFTGFTPSQVEVLEQLLALAPQVYVTVTIDARESISGAVQEHELFALSKKTIHTVLEAAGRAAKRSALPFEIRTPVILNGPGRFRPEGELHFLEQNLFRGHRSRKVPQPGEVSLHEAPSPAREALFAASTISRMLKENVCRCRDIAVIAGDLPSYEMHLQRTFARYDIPVFIDRTSRILLNPCLEFVRTAFEVAESRFETDTVVRLLRTGMCGLTMDETDCLENYLLSSGIRGRSAWEKPFICRKKDPGERELAEAARCETLRQRFMEQFGAFTLLMEQKEANVETYARGLSELLTRCGIQQKLRDQELAFAQQGNEARAREYSQIYGILIRLLEETVNLMGTQIMSGQEFARLLDAGFEEAKVGIIPPTIDQVQVGELERTRLSHVKYLFFLGLNDGWVPAAKGTGGLLSDLERECLKERGAILAPTGREEGYTQRFYLYQNLTKPSVHLYLSWCRSDNDGKAMRPSYVVRTVRELLPYLTVRDEEQVQKTTEPLTAGNTALDYLARGLRAGNEGPDASWREVYRILRQEPEFGGRLAQLREAAGGSADTAPLSGETSRGLYGTELEGSVSRLEQFSQCAFAHFASYGLRLMPRELFEVTRADLGTMFHGAMEELSREVRKDREITWESLAEGQGAQLADRCVDAWAEQYGLAALHRDARTEYQISRVKRIMRRTVQTAARQIAAGTFTPKAFEVSFRMLRETLENEAVTLPLEEGGKLLLSGRIDRVDTCETDREVLVRVVDYKSGTVRFDPEMLYYGLQLQLMVYLDAAMAMQKRFSEQKETVPAGIFYYHMQDPFLEKEEGMTQEEIDRAMQKKLRLDGVVNSRKDILSAMDASLADGTESLVIPAGIKKDGMLLSRSSVLSTEAFAQAERFVRGRMTGEGNRILKGEVAPSPYRLGSRTACDYCDYADVCGFDKKLPGMRERRLAPLKEEEAWKKILEEGGDPDGGELD